MQKPSFELSRYEYSFYKDAFFSRMPYEKALGKLNPYTGQEIKCWDDYMLYCHCYILKSKSEQFFKYQHSRLTSQIDDLNKEVQKLNCKISDQASHLQADSKRITSLRRSRIFFFALSVVFLFICLFSPSRKDYQKLQSDYDFSQTSLAFTQKKLEQQKEKTDTAYASGYDHGYALGYKDGKSVSATTSSRTSGSSPNYTPGTNKPAVETSYIGNKSSKKFHVSTCSYLPDSNNQVSLSSREEAVDSGYSPCKRCNP